MIARERKVILVVDDEESIRDILRHCLEKRNYVVIEANHGGNALEVMRGFHVDLLITDLVMPEKEGLETIMAVKSRNPNMKVIAMSGAANSATYLNIAAGLGACATLQKPFRTQDVADLVAKVLNAENTARASGAAPHSGNGQ